MRLIHKLVILSWLWLLSGQISFAGTITTSKSGTTQSLVVNYSPDPDGSLSSSELSITVTTAVGAAALSDRNLEVVLYVGSQFGRSIAYPVQVTLPQGSTTATAKLHYCQPNQYGQWVVDVFEDGRSIAQPRSTPSSLNNQQIHNWLDITPTGLTKTSSFQMDFGLTNNIAKTVGLSEVPEDWRTFLAFDAVAIPQSQLEIASPAQVHAIATYVLAGGSLVVHAADSSGVMELDRLTISNRDLPSRDYRWEPIETVDRKFGFKRSHGGGRLIVLEQTPPTVSEHINTTIQHPISEFATTTDSDINWFWRNLVQSVGTAPVWGFVVFVTFFVLAVGPFLLRLTTKMQHRTLLLFLVPALSLVATLLVMIYNVVREGFGTYGRVASVQFLDNHSGQGFTWSRQSYFSGAPPRELRFPNGAILKPVAVDIQSGSYHYDPRDSVSTVIRSDGESQVVSEWLLPRNQQQILVGQRTDGSKLPISITRISETAVKVTNLTEHPIPLLFLRQSIEAAYLTRDLQPGQSQELVAESANKIDALLKISAGNYEPQTPEAIDVNSIRYNGYYNRRSGSDSIDNVTRKVTCNRLNDYGFWILLNQPPDIALPFDKSVYQQEKHYHIMTGVSPW